MSVADAFNVTDNGTFETLYFEQLLTYLVPTIFSIIVIVGIIGNLLVIIVVVSNQQMRNSTNILIVSLAVADISFLVFCVPFTATGYAMSVWPFGNAWCKAVNYLTYVCAYASVYTLVLMSFDRYMAVVHAIRSMTVRTERNAYIMVAAIWIVILLGNIPVLSHFEIFSYYYNMTGENRSACINTKIMVGDNQGVIFYGCFFAFGYAIPLALNCVLYGLMLKRLLYGVVPGGSQSAESARSKRRVTRMVIIVVAVFAICWLPIQIVLMAQATRQDKKYQTPLAIMLSSNCLAYMNSCINPILYAFLSDNFRKNFLKIICCVKPSSHQYDCDRTNNAGRGMESRLVESTALRSMNNV